MVFVLARKLAPRTPPQLPVAVFAVHPLTIFSAVEIRSFALAILLSALLLLFFWDGYRQNNRRARWMYLATALIAVYTNIFLILLLIALAAALLITERFDHNKLLHLALGMMSVAVAFVPMLLILSQVTQDVDLSNSQISLSSAVVYAVGSLEYVIWPLPRIDATRAIRAVLLVVLAIGSFLVIWQAWARLKRKHWLMFSNLAVLTILLALFIFASGLSGAPRYAYVLLIPSIFCWAMLIELCHHRRFRYLLWLISLAFCFMTLVIVYRPLCKTGDWIRVVNYIEQNEQPDQPILAFTSDVETAIGYYYDGPNQVIPLPSPQRFDRFAVADFAIPDRLALATKFQPVLQTSLLIWLVTYDDAILNRNEGIDVVNYRFLQEFIDENYEVLETQSFYHSTVRLLQRIGP